MLFRGPLMMATLTGTAQSVCHGCLFNVSALEEFFVDFSTVTYFESYDNDHFSNESYSFRMSHMPLVNFETSPLPSTFPTDHGSIALHARNLQLKLESYTTFPSDFKFGGGYHHEAVLPLSGLEIHEELHINGAARQASYHLESPILNVCVQVDFPPQVTVPTHLIDEHLQQAEQFGPLVIEDNGARAKVNGEDVVGLVGVMFISDMDGTHPDNRGEGPSFLFTESGHPALVTVPGLVTGVTPHDQALMQPAPSLYVLEHLAIKFDNYAPTVGDAFAVRACDIESHSATQSLFASNTVAREFIVNRLAQHQSYLQAVLEPQMLNMRFNFIPLEVLDFMFPAQQPCTTAELAQIPSAVPSSFHMVVFAVGSLAAGMVATLGVLRMKTGRSAECYHQVSP